MRTGGSDDRDAERVNNGIGMGMKTRECQAGRCAHACPTYTALGPVCLQDKPSERSGRAWSAIANQQIIKSLAS